MNGIDETGRLKATTEGLIVLVIFVLAAGTVSAVAQSDAPEQDGLLGPSQAAPQHQNTNVPPRFGPARPSPESPAAFTPDMPFGRAIDILRNSTWPPLNLVVLWREIEENAGVDKSTTIGIDGLQGLRVRQCLDILLNSLSATATTKIGYTVDHGVIIVATVDSLPKPKRVTRVYDISDLVAPPSRAMGYGMMPGMMPGMMSGMMPGMMSGMGGGMSYGGYSPGYGGNYGMTSGYNSGGGLPGFVGGMQGMGVYR